MLHLFIFKSLCFLLFVLAILLNVFNRVIGTVYNWKHFQMGSVLQEGIQPVGHI